VSGEPFRTVYRDAALLVVDKPAGLLVHPAPASEGPTLAQLVAGQARGGERQRAGIVHRLDRDTSGLLVVALQELAYERLRAALARREIRREYLALVAGRLEAGSGTIEAPIGRDPRRPTRRAVGGRGVRPARTHFQVLAQLVDTTLLAVTLDSGRTHQIRVHLRSIGHPLVGDPLYGGPQLAGLRRQFLHAARLCFDHPLDGRSLAFSSPLPEELLAALAAARANPVTIRRR